MTERTVDAPAKINLGLEILGKRHDGYHEIRSVLCMISLHDTLTFATASTGEDEIEHTAGDPGVVTRDNLIVRALASMRVHGARIPPQRVTVTKRIPAAAGLGGASSDAASTLLAFAAELEHAGIDPAGIALTLGSDVSFFLNGPVAMVSGRGETLSPIPPPDAGAWVVLVTPRIHIPAKTRTIYGAVDRASWSSGIDVQAIADRLPALPAVAPPNVFEVALLRLFPWLVRLKARMSDAGAPFVALTGAGPTFYTLLGSQGDAEVVASRLVDQDVTTNVCRLGELVGQ